ncbi:MAG TPA: hypothetical protein DCY13_07885 [Verrucomicrobiales bacterium]|nr:hypothetical protein [Verrucomicrobiales bacterium]
MRCGEYPDSPGTWKAQAEPGDILGSGSGALAWPILHQIDQSRDNRIISLMTTKKEQALPVRAGCDA